jgi:O-antigen/teichoic acid export membrane protein
MNNVSWQLPSFMLSAFFSSNVVGQYALGTRLTRVPINLLGLNISRVFNQRAADAHNNNTLPRTVGMTYHYLLRISVFPCLLLGVVGKEIFIVAFGARWAEAGVYCQILSVWVCFWFISSPLSSVLSIVEEQALELRINSLILASRFLSLLIGGLLGSARLALSAFAITGVLVYGYYCLLILNRSGSPASQAFRLLLTNTLVFLPFGLFLLLLKLMSVSPLWVVVAASLCLAAYYVWLVYVDSGARALLATVLRIAPARASPAASR